MKINNLDEDSLDEKQSSINRKKQGSINLRLSIHLHNKIIDFQNSDKTIYDSVKSLMLQSTIKEIDRLETKEEIDKLTRKIANLVAPQKKHLALRYINDILKKVREEHGQ